MRSFLITLALALAAALGVELYLASGSGVPATSTGAGRAKSDMAGVLPDFRLGSDAVAYNQITERPLLNPTRRTAPTQAVAAATEPPKPQIRRGLYQLVGVTDLGREKIAQVREVSNNRVRSVRAGDVLQELTVSAVEPDRIVLAFQGETDVVQMPKFTASGRLPPPPPPPPPLSPPAVVAATGANAPATVPGAPSAAVQPPPATTAVQLPGNGPRVYPNGLVEVVPRSDRPREVMNAAEFIERRRLARQQSGNP